MLTRIPRTWAIAGAGAFSLLVACNQILGIEEASSDARLTPADPASGGSSGSQAGSQASSESGGTTSSNGGSGGAGHSHSTDAGGPAGGDDGGPPLTGGTTSGSAGSHAHGNATSDAGQSGEGGSGGEDEPADLCDEYCDEMDALCTGSAAQYRDRAQCLRVCRMLPEGVTESPDENSVSCRLKYAKKARYGLGPEVNDYCSQAGPSGRGTCGSVCEGFCSLMVSVCTEQTAGVYHFASEQECRTTCDALPAAGVSYSSSDPAIADGNHALCRLFHVTSAAMADPEEHCEHSLGVTLCEAAPE